jgi:MFS family permease
VEAVTVAGTAPGYRWFLAGAGSWFGAWGMQTVLFSWLVVGELHAPPQWVGVAQTSTMLPTLVLLLMGGVTADRHDPRGLLIRLYLIAAVPVLLLAAAVGTERLALPGLVLYGLCIGTVSSFTMPARDTLLSRVAGSSMMHAVTGTTATQFGAQALGALLAGAAHWVGSAPMLVLQAALLALGSAVTRRVPAAPASEAPPARRVSVLHEIREGVLEVARSSRLRAPLGLAMAVGFLFIGPFLVVFPLLVRDRYHGGVDELSLVLMMFPLGTIAGSLALRLRGGVRRKGRAALVSLASAALILGTVGCGLPFRGVVLATGVWGLNAAVFINCTRTLFQEAAPPGRRARALSVYQLGFMGMGPLGALLSGLLSARIGPLDTLLVFAGGMLAVVAVATLATATPRLE